MDQEDWRVLIDLYNGELGEVDQERLERLTEVGLVDGIELADEKGSSKFVEGPYLTKEGFKVVSDKLDRRISRVLNVGVLSITALYAFTAYADLMYSKLPNFAKNTLSFLLIGLMTVLVVFAYFELR